MHAYIKNYNIVVRYCTNLTVVGKHALHDVVRVLSGVGPHILLRQTVF